MFQEPDRPWSDHQWGLCIFDDVIEYTGPRALDYQVRSCPKLFSKVLEILSN